MSSSRKTFLVGTALLGITAALSGSAVADVGERAVMLTLWTTPKDTDAFDKYFEATHAPLAKQLPGIRSYEKSTGPVTVEGLKTPYYMISISSFDSMAALTSAIESPAGKAAIDDLKNFAAETSLLIFATVPA